MKEKILCTIFCAVVLLTAVSCASGAASYDSVTAYSLAEAGYNSNSRYQSEERMISYSITLSLSVKNPVIAKERILEQVRNTNGFIVRETEDYVTARIPTEKMDSFVNDAKTLGTVDSESKTGTDITDQYHDNVVRLENLKSVRNRYLELLEMADAVSDILSIEKELERVNTEIELLEGRITYAEQSVDYASITVRIKEKAKPGPIGWIFYGLWLGIKWLFVW